MHEGFQTALSVLFPPACLACGEIVDSTNALCGPCWRDTPFIGGVCCDMCGIPQHGPRDPDAAIVCDDCLRHPRNWASGRAALVYRDKGRRIVLSLKHGDRHDIARMAGLWMVRAISDILTPDTLLVPVPLHWTRFFRRTFNQSALLAQAMAQQSTCEVLPDALRRRVRTASLDHSSPSERMHILRQTMEASAKGKIQIGGRHIVIVDDVMTSGATFFEATRACLDAGAAKVSVVALARAAKTP